MNLDAINALEILLDFSYMKFFLVKRTDKVKFAGPDQSDPNSKYLINYS